MHLRDYGIPTTIRKIGKPIEWYLENVKPRIMPTILDNLKQPVCFMCMEKDINSCHRKVILDALIAQGLSGKDLYPVEESSC